MILLSVSQVLRDYDKNPLYDSVIDMCINDIFKYFVKSEKKALLELVGTEGEIIDNPEGRCINPSTLISEIWLPFIHMLSSCVIPARALISVILAQQT